MSRLLAIVQILRPHNMLAASGCIVAGYLLSGGRDGREIVLPFVFTAVVTGLGNLINDYFDREIDEINKPGRPIPSGRLAADPVRWLYGVGTALNTVAMIVWLHGAMLALMMVWQGLLFYYAWHGKRVTLVGNLLVAGIGASAFVGGAIPTGHFPATVYPAVLAFLLVMGRELIKGAEDIPGDRKAGATTVAVRFGAGAATALAALSLFVCVIITPIPGLIHYYGVAYLLVMELLFVPGVLAAACLVLRSNERALLHRASRILKIEMFFGILAMALGRL